MRSRTRFRHTDVTLNSPVEPGAVPAAAQRRSVLILAGTLLLVAPSLLVGQDVYFPGPGEAWERRAPEEVGMNAALLAEAVEFAIASETQAPRDLLENHIGTFGQEPMGEAIGPFRERGDAAGVVIRNGYIVAEWGDVRRVEPTFSVTKSFLSTTVGLAWDAGLIRDLHDPVRNDFAPVVALKGPPTGDGGGEGPLPGAAYDAFEVLLPFESEHNSAITWDHLLRQTSDWEGTLWGKPDWADRPRGDYEEWRNRDRNAPGTSYMYNDVRVNLLALASLNIWRQPLPEVLRERVMDPIGASRSWRWFGYDNSWVVLDGRLVQSVSGGAHWGGGMWISALDLARFGYLTLREGRWGDEQILSEEWVAMALTPTPVQQGYGFMNWYLTSDGSGAFSHRGAGPNTVYVNPEHDLVIVTRWVGGWNGVVQRILEAVD
jgi:CubicO group peptidase (beta-lactamase class C family)